MVNVVAALIWKDDKFLICQRPAHKARGLLWEFVGGKVEEGEEFEEALVRECREELSIEIKPINLFMQVEHVYADITISLWLYNAVIVSGTPLLLEHVDMKWIKAENIDDFEFCPADKEILEKIKCNT